jgi:enamine deaminase RidA (YjgF/YER057c/UK114 family)
MPETVEKRLSQLVNGCSDLMVEVFGDRGRHARSAVGVSSLPENITVEIEAIFEIR